MRWVVSGLSLAAVVLGLLWVLQGTGLVVISPIACIGECQPLNGPSVEWVAAGIVLIALAGATLLYTSRR